MSVEIFDRKSFHFCEHIITQVAQASLGNIDHNAVIGISRNNADGVKACNTCDCGSQGTKIRRICFEKRCDVLVDQSFHEHGSLDISQDADKNTDHNNYDMNTVVFENIAGKTSEKLTRLFRCTHTFRTRTARIFHILFLQAGSPPSSKSPAPPVCELNTS